MEHISMIKIELLDYYVKCLKGIELYSQKIDEDCIDGYISEKKINGKEYHYLQWTENGKIRSKYIKPEHLNVLKKSIYQRHEYEKIIKDMKQSMKEIKAFIGAEMLNEYLKVEQL